MTDPATKPRRRAWWKYLLIVTVAGVVCLLAGLWYLTTESFQNYVRRRVVAEVERITGGHAEVGSFHTIPFRMIVEVRDFTVHGREGAGEAPLVHADRFVARFKIHSLVRTEFGFHEVSIERPVVHVAFYADGSSNVPSPPVQRSSDKDPLAQLFSLSIDHLYVDHGELQWGDQKIPLEFDVHDTDLQMDYSFLRARYEGRFLLGKIDTKFDGWRPFAWMTAGEFSLGRSFADIKSVKLNSGRSHLEASGRISDFGNPHINATYDAYVDLAEASAIARRNDLREGTLELKGQGNWSLDQFAASGSLAMREIGWKGDQFALRKVNATSDYSVTDRQLKLTKLQGRLLSGSFSGDAEIENWLHSVPPSKGEEIAVITAARPPKAGSEKDQRVRPAGVQTGVAHLKWRDVSQSDIATALNTAAHPLGRLRPAGTAGGTLEGRWRGSPGDADVTFAIDLTGPPYSSPGQLPVTAHAQGVYHGSRDQLDLAQLNISTPASRVQAAGVLSDASTLRVSVTTSNMEEWRPLVAALHGPADLPFRVNNNATFSGVIGGKLLSPTLAGTLVAEDFGFIAPATSRTPEQEVHWDSLSTSVQLSSRGVALHGGSLRRGDTSADFEVTASLLQGEFTDDSVFTARVNLHNVDIASTAAIAGYDYPITGTVDLSLQASGTKAEPEATGRIHANNVTAYDEAIAELDADLNISGGETELSNIRLLHQDATVTGSAAYNPATRAYRVDLIGKNFDLARVRQIHSDRMLIEGRGDFSVQGSGTLDTPSGTARIHIRDLTLDHELSGGLVLDFVTKGRELEISGHSEFPHGSVLIDGSVQLHDDYPAKIAFSMDHLDLDALWRSYLRGQLTGHSAVAGTLNMQGPLRDRRQWTLNGNLSEMFLDVESVKLRNQGPVWFRYDEQILHLDQLHLVGEGTDLSTHGIIDFARARQLNFSADGRIDLKLLHSFDPGYTASGDMSMNMTVGGTIGDPFPQGRLQLTNGAIAYSGLPSGLSEMNGSLLFTRDRFHIETLTARTGGGSLDLKGDASLFNGQVNFNFTAIGKDVRLRYPPGVSSTATAELHWSGTNAASTVSGEIMVNKLAVTPNFDFSTYLERSRQISSLTPATSPLYNVKLDIHVQTAPELQMKTAVARLSGDADLRLRGTAARPVVLGRADVLEGEATFNGTKFRLERGDITFANPVTIQPILNLEASTHVRSYDLAITVTGTPDQPGGLRVNYRSEPPLPQSDIIALLALGRTNEESEQLQEQSGQTPFTNEASALIINQAINSTVTSRMQKLFGVSRIKIDPQGLTTETNPTARGPQVTIEQQFANNLSLTYSTNVSQSSQQIIQGEYYFTRNVSAVGTRDQNGVVSFDVRIRRRKK